MGEKGRINSGLFAGKYTYKKINKMPEFYIIIICPKNIFPIFLAGGTYHPSPMPMEGRVISRMVVSKPWQH